MSRTTTISLGAEFEKLTFLPDRRPDTNTTGWFAELAAYRDGAIVIVHYAGHGEWERHPNCDDIVLFCDGKTPLVLLMNGREIRNPLQPGQLVVVPENTWHRFESAQAVKVLTVTPQPTDHSKDSPL